jgi:alpha-mannosidase
MLYDQRWFRLSLTEGRRGAPVRYLEWRDQGEATLWIDGQPHYGFDVAHRRAPLPARFTEAWIEGYCCQTAIWHPDATGLSPEGSRFGGAFLAQRDDALWDFVQDLQFLSDLAKHLRVLHMPLAPRELPRVGPQPALEQAPPAYRILMRGMSDALDELDSHGLAEAAPVLKATLARLRDGNSPLRAVLTGHAHIDLVWLWPERIGEAKAVHTFATVNRLMDLYPEFRFAYSQPASYRAVARRSPGLARAVGERIGAGQWQPTGAMEVESDTQLPCGEALARSLLLGQEGFTRLTGRPSRLLWLPDVFGYSACLPQLMRLAGVDWFFTTKLTWSAITRFPHSSFLWRGNDGSEVVAHVTQNAGYNNRLDLEELDANAWGHVQADVHPEFLHPTGYGDGGGGPTEEMCERARRLAGLAGMPSAAWDQPEDFFARLEKRRHLLPVHQGECYLEYHRGVLTTHGELKDAFRGLERALQAREAVAVSRGSAPDLTEAWRRMVFAQFHDYIPGSSVADVYHEGIPELRRLAKEQRQAALAELGTRRGQWQAFNQLPLPWKGWLTLPGASAPTWTELSPLSSSPLPDPSPAPAAAELRGRTLQNGRVRARVGEDGWLRQLEIDGCEIAVTGPAARAVLYPDTPANYDAWDIDRHTLGLGVELDGRPSFRVESKGPVAAVLAVTRKVGKASSLTLRYLLEAGAAVLRLEAELDWHEERALLKLHFPTSYRGRNARFGAPFGSVLRVQQPGELGDEAQWEVPGSRWAAISHDDGAEGLALVTEAKYGFSAKDGDLSVSLLRSARITGSEGDRYSVPEDLHRHRPPSTQSDQGRHVIRLALGAYDSSGVHHSHPAALADTLFTTPLLFKGVAHSSGLLAVEGAPTLIPAWAMPLDEHSWVLRLHEVSGRPGTADLRLAEGWKAARCSLDGRSELGAISAGRLGFRPYEVLSILLRRPGS